MKNHLKALCSLEGVSGREDRVRAYILDALAQSAAEMDTRVDPLGNVLVWLKGRRRAARTLYLEALQQRVELLPVLG